VDKEECEVEMVGFSTYIKEAVSKSKLFSNTDDGRKFRGDTQVKNRRSPLSLTGSKPELERVDYIVKAKPSIEKKTHWGYVDYDEKTGEIHEMFCDCSDFFYRLYAPLVKDDLATWDLEEKFKTRLIQTHNRDWTKVTNPDGKLFICKHLYHIVNNYIDI